MSTDQVDKVTVRLLEEELQAHSRKVNSLLSKKDDLVARLQERNESYHRVSERLTQTKNEIRARERELGVIQNSIASHQDKQRALYEQGDGTDSSALVPRVGAVAEEMDLETAYKTLREELEKVGSAIGVKPMGMTGGIRDLISSDSILFVTIEYDDDACSFRITPEYRFKDLTEDACRYWGLDPFSSALRDSTNTVWPMHGNVREVLLQEVLRINQGENVTISLPRIRLVGNRVSGGKLGQQGGLPGGMIASQPRGSGGIGGSDQLEYERDFLEQLLRNEDVNNRKNRKNKHTRRVREAQIAAARTLSEFFHDPHEQPDNYRNALFRTPESFVGDGTTQREMDFHEEALKTRAKFSGICLKLFFWLVFIILFSMSSFYRFGTGIIYSSTVSFQKRLVLPFEMAPPLQFTAPNTKTTRYIYSYRLEEKDSPILGGSWGQGDFPFSQLEDMWNFLFQVIQPILFGWNDPSSERSASYSLTGQQQFLVSNVAIRQNRVRNNSCTIVGQFQGIVSECFAPYTERFAQTTQFSVFNESEVGDSSVPAAWERMCAATPCTSELCQAIVYDAFQYTEISSGALVAGEFGSYDASGYYVILPADMLPGEVRQVVCGLLANGWVGQATRAIYIEFVIFNANINFFIKTNILIEASHTGATETTIWYNRMGTSLYNTGSQVGSNTLSRFLIAADVVCLIYVCILLYLLIQDVLVYGFIRIFSTVWNAMMLLVICGFVAALICRIVFEFSMQDLPLDSPESYNSVQHDSLYSIYETALWLDVFTFFFSILLVFKFTQANHKVSAIFETIHRSSRFAAALLFILFLLMFATAVTAFLVYGVKLPGWRTFQKTLGSLLEFLTGNISYVEYHNADAFFSPFFYLFVMVYFAFIGVAYITAVYIDAYYVVSSVGIQDLRPKNFWSQLFLAPLYACSRSNRKYTAKTMSSDADKKNQ